MSLLHRGIFRLLTLVAALIGVTTFVTVVSSVPLAIPASAQPSCGGGPPGQIYWAAATSGYGSDIGTRVTTTSWTYWDVPSPASEWTDDAAWLIDKNNYGISVEAGFSVGWDSINGDSADYMYPYYTRNDGNPEVDDLGDELGTGGALQMYIKYNTSTQKISVYVAGATLGTPVSYSFPTPRLNASQGEVWSDSTQNSDYVTMSGGSDEFQGYSLPAGSTTWNPWGFHNDCDDSPFWLAWASNSSWYSGGQEGT